MLITHLLRSPAIQQPQPAPEPQRLRGNPCRRGVIPAGVVQCDVVQGLLPDGEHGFLGMTAFRPARAARGGSRAMAFVSQSICREAQIAAAEPWPERRPVLWLRWKVSLFFCRTSLHKKGSGRQRLSLKPHGLH